MSERVTPEELERLRELAAEIEAGAAWSDAPADAASIRALLSERERVREDVTRAVSEFKAAAEACERAARQREDTEGPEPINTGKAAAYRITAGRLNRALASTPNPEERACTCPPSAFTGYYTPANSCPRHGSAPDPTPEPEEGRGCSRCGGGGFYRDEAVGPLGERCSRCGGTGRDPAPTDPTTEEGR